MGVLSGRDFHFDPPPPRHTEMMMVFRRNLQLNLGSEPQWESGVRGEGRKSQAVKSSLDPTGLKPEIFSTEEQSRVLNHVVTTRLSSYCTVFIMKFLPSSRNQYCHRPMSPKLLKSVKFQSQIYSYRPAWVPEAVSPRV
jgi:hypothetical protein